MSLELKEKLERYKQLVRKEQLSDEDFAEIKKLSIYLREIPDFLAMDISMEYQKLENELKHRRDIAW